MIKNNLWELRYNAFFSKSKIQSLPNFLTIYTILSSTKVEIHLRLSAVSFLLLYLEKNGNIINTIISTNFLLNYQFNKTTLPKTEPFSIKVCACAASAKGKV